MHFKKLLLCVDVYIFLLSYKIQPCVASAEFNILMRIKGQRHYIADVRLLGTIINYIFAKCALDTYYN